MPGGKRGTLIAGAGAPESGSKSGRYAKSIVEESWTVFRLRDVLKCLTDAVEAVIASEAVFEALEVAASEIAAWTLLKEGLSVVRIEETDAGPVMWSWRALRWVVLEASLERERSEVALETAIVTKFVW